MSNVRRSPSQVEQQILYAQVGGICPLCAEPLVYTKGTGYKKNYELAHIYPLNPTPEEIVLLANEPRLSIDVNSIDNFVPLCLKCHNKFDNPRTVEEYRELFKIKRKLIADETARNIYGSYTIQDEICDIIQSLISADLGSASGKLEYTALKVEQKLQNSFNPILKRKIIADVTDYYKLIKKQFNDIEKTNPGTFDLIGANIKAFYLHLKKQDFGQEKIYNTIADWIYIKTKAGSIEACKVIVSFFIQNCEVFESVSQ